LEGTVVAREELLCFWSQVLFWRKLFALAVTNFCHQLMKRIMEVGLHFSLFPL